jgi:hypothetical protein
VLLARWLNFKCNINFDFKDEKFFTQSFVSAAYFFGLDNLERNKSWSYWRIMNWDLKLIVIGNEDVIIIIFDKFLSLLHALIIFYFWTYIAFVSFCRIMTALNFWWAIKISFDVNSQDDLKVYWNLTFKVWKLNLRFRKMNFRFKNWTWGLKIELEV